MEDRAATETEDGDEMLPGPAKHGLAAEGWANGECMALVT